MGWRMTEKAMMKGRYQNPEEAVDVLEFDPEMLVIKVDCGIRSFNPGMDGPKKADWLGAFSFCAKFGKLLHSRLGALSTASLSQYQKSGKTVVSDFHVPKYLGKPKMDAI